MSKQFRFPSIAFSNQFGYMFSDEWRSSRGEHDQVARWAYAYETYGHGLTQHAPEFRIHSDRMTDYLQSLCVEMCKDEEHLAMVSDVHRPIDFEERIKFLMDVKHVPYDSEKKSTWSKQYMNYSDCKLSRVESKRHDKRWEEVTEWMDGSADFVFRYVYANEYGSGLIFKYSLMENIKEVWKRYSDRWCNTVNIEKQLFDDENTSERNRKIWAFENAYQVFDNLTTAHRKTKWAKGAMERWADRRAEESAKESEKSEVAS